MSKIKVLIVDDHQLSGLGAQAMIQQDNSIHVIGLVNTGEAAIEFISQKTPDVVLLDVFMKDMDGFETLKKIKELNNKIKVIMFTISEEKDIIIKIMALKADGMILKDVIKEDLVKAIKKVSENGYAFSPGVLDILINDIISFASDLYKSTITGSNGHDKGNGEFHKIVGGNFKSVLTSKLASREYEVLSLIGQGMSSEGISAHLNLSIYTINTYRKNLYAKLGIKSLKSLVSFAKSLQPN